MAEPTVEIRVRDGDEENAVSIPLKAVPGYFVDAHRLLDMWANAEPFTVTAIDYLRSMARHDYIASRLPQCAVVMAFALLQGQPAYAVRRISAALAVAGTVLDVDLSQDGTPVYCAKLADAGELTLQ